MDQQRWLDEDEQRAWRGFLRMHAEVTSRLHRQMHRDSGLSYADYEVLVQLSEAPEGRLRAFQLGEALNWEKSRLSHQLSRMQARGLVAREECETDGRGAFVVITPEGLEEIRVAAPRHVAEVRRVFLDALTREQLVALAEVAETVTAHLAEQADREPAAARPAPTR